jgi:hypothetical protein
MQKVTFRIRDDAPDTDAFHAQAGILVQQILSLMDRFKRAMETMYDRCKQT